MKCVSISKKNKKNQEASVRPVRAFQTARDVSELQQSTSSEIPAKAISSPSGQGHQKTISLDSVNRIEGLKVRQLQDLYVNQC
jgi:hypothetical protein